MKLSRYRSSSVGLPTGRNSQIPVFQGEKLAASMCRRDAFRRLPRRARAAGRSMLLDVCPHLGELRRAGDTVSTSQGTSRGQRRIAGRALRATACAHECQFPKPGWRPWARPRQTPYDGAASLTHLQELQAALKAEQDFPEVVVLSSNPKQTTCPAIT